MVHHLTGTSVEMNHTNSSSSAFFPTEEGSVLHLYLTGLSNHAEVFSVIIETVILFFEEEKKTSYVVFSCYT